MNPTNLPGILWNIALSAGTGFFTNRLSTSAAAMAFYTMFAIGPIMIFSIAIAEPIVGRLMAQEAVFDALGTVRNASISVGDGVPANRTIAGYIAGSDGFHRHRWMPDAPRAFGHPGAGGQLNWCDPDSGISFSFLHDTVNANPTVEFRRAADWLASFDTPDRLTVIPGNNPTVLATVAVVDPVVVFSPETVPTPVPTNKLPPVPDPVAF